GTREHHAGAVVPWEREEPFEGAGREDHAAGAYVPQPLELRSSLESDREAVIVEAERRGSREHGDVGGWVVDHVPFFHEQDVGAAAPPSSHGASAPWSC